MVVCRATGKCRDTSFTQMKNEGKSKSKRERERERGREREREREREKRIVPFIQKTVVRIFNSLTYAHYALTLILSITPLLPVHTNIYTITHIHSYTPG